MGRAGCVHGGDFLFDGGVGMIGIAAGLVSQALALEVFPTALDIAELAYLASRSGVIQWLRAACAARATG
jgi:hypothetical protein